MAGNQREIFNRLRANGNELFEQMIKDGLFDIKNQSNTPLTDDEIRSLARDLWDAYVDSIHSFQINAVIIRPATQIPFNIPLN